MSDRKNQEVIFNYITARKAIIELGKVNTDIQGNDNIIGRIGEYYAIKFLRKQFGQETQKVENCSNKGFDLKSETHKIQVKVITQENKAGRTVRLVEGWTQFILIELDDDYIPQRIGILEYIDFQQALRENPHWSINPFVKLTMLGKKGLIGRYGKVFKKGANLCDIL